jgi:hypothetical protein
MEKKRKFQKEKIQKIFNVIIVVLLMVMDSFLAFWLLPISVENAGVDLSAGCASATFSLTTILSVMLIYDVVEG